MNCPDCGAANDGGADTCFHCGKSLFALTKSSVLSDRYEILQPLGKGGMGMVYKACDRTLEETVAIKVLRPDIEQTDDIARRFRNEIRLARRVRHKNVCAIHEYGQHGHLYFIVMEYIEGTDFKQILRRGPLSPLEACTVLAEVADGLQAIHEVGIVHRDLKTPNIMRDAHGVVRLMDFGIAKQFDTDASSATATGMIVGTPEYMSPEQAKAEKVDQRSDIYALGIMLFELLTAELPFRGDTPVATLMLHLTQRPPLDRPGLPPTLVPILRKALAKSREERYSSAAEVATAVREARQMFLSAPTPPAPTRPVLRPVAPPSIPIADGAAARVLQAEAPATTPMPTPRQPSAHADPDFHTAVQEASPTTAQKLPTQKRSAIVPVTLVAAAMLVAVLAMAFLYARFMRTPPVVSSLPQQEQTSTPVALASSPPTAAPSTPAAETRAVAPVAKTTLKPAVTSQRVATNAPAVLPTEAVITATPAPAPTTSPVATAVPTLPSPPPTREPKPEATAAPMVAVPPSPATLFLKIKPWAEVTVDGIAQGRATRLALRPGLHQLTFSHPDFEPLKRGVTLSPGEARTLAIDLRDEALKRKR
jgi:serine/threonine protein kinase